METPVLQFRQFLNKIVDESMVVAKRDYGEDPKENHLLRGALAGLEACRDKSPPQLSLLLQRASVVRQKALHATNHRRYAWLTCFLDEVEWVCNVVSAALANQDMPIIVSPTERGLMTAARIIHGEAVTN